ncbi:uncharacterized protein LOC135498152 [Lineus longissimus]|uniref:uncharacterized protein LOC135498152 n=1 Tax=Lineus longissimus TaxID=88925 RepID=UPI002B4DEEA6
MSLASLIMSFMGMVLLVQSDPCPRCNSTGRYNGFQCTEMKRQRDIVPINGSILLMNITSGVCSTLNVTIDDKNVLNDEWATNCQSCYLNITCKTSALYKFKSGNETLHEVKCDDVCPAVRMVGMELLEIVLIVSGSIVFIFMVILIFTHKYHKCQASEGEIDDVDHKQCIFIFVIIACLLSIITTLVVILKHTGLVHCLARDSLGLIFGIVIVLLVSLIVLILSILCLVRKKPKSSE